MSGFINPYLTQPINPDSAPWEWQRAVEIFENGNMAALELAINNWFGVLKATYQYVAIIDIIYIGSGAGNNSRVLVSYGYFTTPA
jgi:hypothetical protein